MLLEKWFNIDLLKPPAKLFDIGVILYTGDDNGVRIGVNLSRGGEAETATGTVNGYVIIPDGSTLPVITGETERNRAWIDLPEDAMVLTGGIQVAIRLVDGTQKTTVFAGTALVHRIGTEDAYDPSGRIPTWDDVESKIEQMDQATSAATTAAEDATSAAASATAAAAAGVRTDTDQGLTDTQKAQARSNIGAASASDIPSGVVLYTAQTLTDEQKTQARTNIASASSEEVDNLKSAITQETDNLFWFTSILPYESGGLSISFIDRSTIKINGTATGHVYMATRGAQATTDKTTPAGTYIYKIELLSGTGAINKLRYNNGSTQVNMNEPFTLSEAAGLLFTIRNGQTCDNAVFRVTLNEGTELKPYIEGGATAVDKVAREALADLSPVVEETASKLESGIDLGDLSPMLQGAFRYEYEQIDVTLATGYIGTDGQYNDYSSAKYATIAVEAGQHYKLASNHGSDMKMFVFVDSDNNVVEYYPIERVSTHTETKEYTVPADGTLYLNTFGNAVGVYLVTGITAEKEPLDATWYLFGDSWSAPITDGKKWCDYVADELHLTLANMAVSGRGYKKASSGGTGYFGAWINSKLPQGFSGLLTVFGSGNDCDGSVWDLGTSDDLYDPADSTSPDTIGGRINYAFSVIKTKAPLAKVLIIGPCPWQIYAPSVANNRMLQYIAMLDECCKKAGFMFVDMYYRCGLRPWDDAQADLWSEQAPTNRVHPNLAGHYFLYPQMANVIRQIVPDVAYSE